MLLLLAVREVEELNAIRSRRVRRRCFGVVVDHEAVDVRLLHVAVREGDDDAPVRVDGPLRPIVEVNDVASVP